jgi:hypothetical protein
MRPFGVLNAEKMENVLYDIYIADATMSTRHISTDQKTRREYYDYIFEKHHVTRATFEKSMAWYAHNPKKLEQIYDKVKERVNKLQVDVENYVYHPENKELDENKMLDTINLVKFENHYSFKNQPPKDSLFFELKNRDYFALKDRFIWSFLMKIEPLDTNIKSLAETKTYLTITYTNGAEKTMRGKLICDTKTYRYTFQMPVNDSLVPVAVRGSFFDGKDMVRSVSIDSAQLIRIYNEEKYPLIDSLKIKFGKITPEDTIKKVDIENALNNSRDFDRRNVLHPNMQRMRPNAETELKVKK